MDDIGPHLVTLATVVGLIGLPGFAVARWVVPRELRTFAGVIANSAVLGIGFLLLPATAWLALNGSMESLVVVVVGLVLLALGAGAATFRKPAAQPTRDTPARSNRRERLALWILIAPGAVLFLGFVLRYGTITANGDLWTYLAYVRADLESATLDHGGVLGPFDDGRMALSGWLVLQALLSRVSGLDPVDLHSLYLPIVWSVASLAGFLTLARALTRSETAALYCFGVQLVYVLSSLCLTVAAKDPGFSLVFRVNEDKIAVWLLMLPPALALCIRALRARESERPGYVVAIALCLAALGFTHPIGISLIALSIGSFAMALLVRRMLRAVVAKDRRALLDLIPPRRRALRWAALLALSATVVLSIPLTAREILRSTGYRVLEPLPDVGRSLKLLEDHFLVVSSVDHYRASGALLDHPILIVAFLLLPFLLVAARRDDGALFVASNMLVPSAILYLPFLANWFGGIMTPFQLWRLHWAWPASLALGIPIFAGIERLSAASKPRSERILGPALAASLVFLAFLCRSGVREGIWYCRQVMDHQGLDPRARAALESLATTAAPGAAVLAPRELNPVVPAFVSRARVLASRFAGPGTPMGLELDRWFDAEELDEARVRFLERNRVRHVVAQEQDLVTEYLERLGSTFERTYAGDGFVVYRYRVDSLHAVSTADRAFLQKSWSDALDGYEARGDRAGQALVLTARARELQKRAQLPEAIEGYRRASRLDPGMLSPRIWLAWALVGRAASAAEPEERWEASRQAKEALTSSLSLSPAHRVLHRVTLRACRVLGDCSPDEEPLSRVLSAARREVEMVPERTEPVEDLAAIYTALGEREELLSLRRSVVERWPSWGRGFLELGKNLMDGGRENEAIVAFEDAIARDVFLGEAYQSLTRLYGDRGRGLEWLAALEAKKHRLFRAPWWHLLTSRIRLEESVDLERAMVDLEALIRRNPQYGAAYRYLDDVYEKQGDSDRPERFFQRLRAENPNMPVVAEALAGVLVERGRLDAAAELLERQIAQTPDHRGVYDSLSRVQASKGLDVESRAMTYEKAIAPNPGQSWPFVRLSSLYEESGRFDEAWSVTERAGGELHSADARTELLLEQGRLLMDEKRFEESAERFRLAVATSPDDAQAHVNLGAALRLDEEFRAAKVALSQAARLSPRSSSLLRVVGEGLLLSGYPADAVPVLERSLHLNPADERIARLLEQARASSGAAPLPPGSRE